MLSQKLLEAVFGDQAVRTLTTKAREDLRLRVEEILGDEAARFTGLLDAVEPPEGAARALRAAVSAVRDGGGIRGGIPAGAVPEGGSAPAVEAAPDGRDAIPAEGVPAEGVPGREAGDR
nr:hypothetical protein GCM10020093_065920 [Planobispora longispora]